MPSVAVVLLPFFTWTSTPVSILQKISRLFFSSRLDLFASRLLDKVSIWSCSPSPILLLFRFLAVQSSFLGVPSHSGRAVFLLLPAKEDLLLFFNRFFPVTRSPLESERPSHLRLLSRAFSSHSSLLRNFSPLSSAIYA